MSTTSPLSSATRPVQSCGVASPMPRISRTATTSGSRALAAGSVAGICASETETPNDDQEAEHDGDQTVTHG